jgi:succinate dehydrogenase / fumarate reductase iron-sulfur subunit
VRTVEIKVRRFQPERGQQHYWQTFQVAVESNDRLLDALNKIKWEQDGSLTFRRSCAHGVCGSDAMRVNGRNRLA